MGSNSEAGRGSLLNPHPASTACGIYKPVAPKIMRVMFTNENRYRPEMGTSVRILQTA
jgi:hypothetical protein